MHTHNDKFTYLLPALGIVLIAALTWSIIYSKSNNRNAGQWITRWHPVNQFTFPRRALAAVTARGYVYVVGGVDTSGNYVKTTEFAKIMPDGTLSNWQATQPLNVGRFYLAAVHLDGYIYALGGGTGDLGESNQPITTVERAKILADGSLSPWQMQNSMKIPRRGLKAVSYGNRIYAIGGYSGVFLKSIEYAGIDPQGQLGHWVVDPKQSLVDRYIHSAALHDNTLYLLGGHVQQSDKMSYGDVERTEIGDNGELLGWQIEQSRLLVPRFIASAFVLNRKLYILGGHNGGLRLNSVEVAPIYSSGMIGQWEQSTPMTTARSATAVAIHEHFIYVLGGMSNNAVLNTVEMARPTRSGELGFMAK